MKKLILLFSIILILVLATPAFAGEKEPVGESLDWEVVIFDASTPFHMRHGFLFGTPPLVDPIGNHKYELEFDGDILKPDFQIMYDRDSGQLVKIYVFNFPDGMTGVHNFIHHYYGPCYIYFAVCEFPHKSVEFYTVDQWITFTE